MQPFNISVSELLKLREELKRTRKGYWEIGAGSSGGKTDIWLVTEEGKEPVATFCHRAEALYAITAREWLPRIVDMLLVEMLVREELANSIVGKVQCAIVELGEHRWAIQKAPQGESRGLFLNSLNGWSEISNIAYPPLIFDNNMQATAYAGSMGLEEVD